MLSWAAWHCTVKRRRLGARKTFCFAALKRELKTLNTSSTSNQTSSLKPIPPKIRFSLQDSRAVEKNPKMVGVHFSQGWWLTKSFASGARKCKSGRMMKMSFVEQGTEHFCKPHLTLNNCWIYPRRTHTQISAAIFILLNLLHHEWRQALSLSFFQGLPKKLAKPTEKKLCYLNSARVEHYICYIGILQRQIFNGRCKKRKSLTSGTSAKHLQVTQSNGDFTFFTSFFYKTVIKQGWCQKTLEYGR